MEQFDVIIVGAGPAGSTAAYRLAREGVHVLLLDKARFPRDKPCGGGVTVRALRELPFDIRPIVEHAVHHIEFSFRGHRGLQRGGRRLLAYMTQRHRLDHFLVEHAVAAGAAFRDGVKVSEISEHGARVDGRWIAADLMIGADGVNGPSARALGLAGERLRAVALEGNVAYRHVADPGRWRGTMVLELGTILGGYGWIFPKGDHLNIGVGAWQSEGRHLREHFRAFCGRHGFDNAKIASLRGYRLAGRGPGSALSGARALLVGEAAGLLDPLLGDGMSPAFLSTRLAAETARDFLAGRNADLQRYDHAVISEFGPTARFGLDAKCALDRLPRTVMAGVLSPPGWGVIEKMIRGELPNPQAETGLQGLTIRGLETLAWLAGRPGDAYRIEAERTGPGEPSHLRAEEPSCLQAQARTEMSSTVTSIGGQRRQGAAGSLGEVRAVPVPPVGQD
jgi:geranylgeranyl reductase family protein